MKKKLLLVMAFVLMLPVLALAQTWYTANQATIGWDAVTKMGDGTTSIPTGDAVKYQVYTKNAAGTIAPVGGEITAIQQTITFNVEGRYFVGVKAIRYPAGETVGVSSDVAWSSDPLVCATAGPFGIVYYVKPAGVKGLKSVP